MISVILDIVHHAAVNVKKRKRAEEKDLVVLRVDLSIMKIFHQQYLFCW